MEYLWNNQVQLANLIKNYHVKILLLDFDGTLTPIVRSPDEVNFSSKTRNLLQSLNKKKEIYLAIISGRNLKDLKEKVGLPNLIYAGNHGLDGEIYQKSYSFPIKKQALITILEIRKKLKAVILNINGAFIEDKGSVISLHYRKILKYQIPLLEVLFNKILKPYKERELVSVIKGKMVYDIYPKVNWNKGEFAILAIQEIEALTKTTPITIFIGDDSTDEEVFKILKKGITIKVGEGDRSNAKYSLKDTADVFNFLNWINATS